MKPLRVGTDCSGIESVIVALNKLKVKYTHEWSCDVDKDAKKSILANFSPKLFFDDMTKPRNLPDIDFYCCGFPCQPFSIAGVRHGFADPRGTIFWECLKVIKRKSPKFFILENVKGLVHHDNGTTFKTIMNCLHKLKLYSIYHKVLNTKDYGIPQNRQRLFIIGIKKAFEKRKLQWPRPKKMKNILDFIDRNDTSKQEPYKTVQKYVNQSKSIFVDLGFIKFVSPTSYQTYSPTIVTNPLLYCVPMKRKANIREYLHLQGFPVQFKQVVSTHQLKRQIGNSITVNVLVELLKEIFKAVK